MMAAETAFQTQHFKCVSPDIQRSGKSARGEMRETRNPQVSEINGPPGRMGEPALWNDCAASALPFLLSLYNQRLEMRCRTDFGRGGFFY